MFRPVVWCSVCVHSKPPPRLLSLGCCFLSPWLSRTHLAFVFVSCLKFSLVALTSLPLYARAYKHLMHTLIHFVPTWIIDQASLATDCFLCVSIFLVRGEYLPRKYNDGTSCMNANDITNTPEFRKKNQEWSFLCE